MIRLVACDLDGTLLDDEKKADQGFKEIIPKLKEKGIRYTFVSGRNEELLCQYIDEFGLEEPYVVNNGGNIYQKHQCLYNDYIPQEYNGPLSDILMKYDVVFRLFSTEKIYAHKDSLFFDKRMGVLKTMGMEYMDPSTDVKDLHIYKITCDFTGKEEILKPLIEELKEKCPKLNFLKAENAVYCANSLTANKGAALKRICDMLEIPMKDVMAFGDADNDLSMLEEAGVSVAMGNSPRDIREKCDYTCADNNHNGISAFLKEYFNL